MIEAASTGARTWGVGSGASHLVSGHLLPHEALEQQLAAFTGFPKALLLSTGFMANLAIVPALVGRGDAVFADKLNHASLIDGMRLAKPILLEPIMDMEVVTPEDYVGEVMGDLSSRRGRVTGMEPTGNVCATHHSQHACVITHMPLTKAFAKIAVNINGVHRQPYAIFRKLKIVETDMMAIYQVMMQVIIPSQSNQRG